MHAPSEEKSDDSKDSFCEELGQVFYHFSKYRIKILFFFGGATGWGGPEIGKFDFGR
jgi:hypothetical protein